MLPLWLLLLLLGRPDLILHGVVGFGSHVLLHFVVGLAEHVASVASLLDQRQLLLLLGGFLLSSRRRQRRLLLPFHVVAFGGLTYLYLILSFYLGLLQYAFHEVIHLLLLG